jgi:small subunit ribosomal protein S17
MESAVKTNAANLAGQPGKASDAKAKIGMVVGDKMQKTVVVAVESMLKHPLYKKPVRRTKRFKAHAEEGVCKVGDRVRIVETRPISKDKHWRVDAVLRPGEQIKIEV